MLHLPIAKFTQQLPHLKPLFPALILTAHTKTCPTKNKPKCPATRGKKPKAAKARPKCPPKGSKGSPKGPTKGPSKGPPTGKGPVCPGSGGGSSKMLLKRELIPGKVRLGMIPNEWFLFFHSKTGVTGPYLFGILLANYLVSKEKFILEHEYYIGLSMFVMSYYVATALGPAIGALLDKDVDEVANSYEKTRSDEIAVYNDTIKQAKDAQWRAEGQILLMNAKKENIAMQLEAIYRERLMQVYNTVKGRMDYHVKLYRAQARIQQKWMLGWILSHVMKSITPELEQQALNRAIEDLAAAAGRAK